MIRGIENRLRRLEAKRPRDLRALSDEELEARIMDCVARLASALGGVEPVREAFAPYPPAGLDGFLARLEAAHGGA
jgi:hypothetical protein